MQALTALLSGEMRDTAELGAMTKHAAENYLPQPSRAHMVSMLHIAYCMWQAFFSSLRSLVSSGTAAKTHPPWIHFSWPVLGLWLCIGAAQFLRCHWHRPSLQLRSWESVIGMPAGARKIKRKIRVWGGPEHRA